MADIEDLPNTSIIDMSNDEAIELLRQIRLSRRTSKKKPKAKKAASTKVKSKMTPAKAAELLKMLTETKK